jgi:hypothetical protein
VTGGQEFPATAPGACAVDVSLGIIYQAQAAEEGLATILRYPAFQSPDLLFHDSGPVAAYRVAGFPSLGPRALVLRATLSDAGPTDLQVWDLRIVAKFAATTVAHGPHVPSYDIVRFGDRAIAGWIGQPLGNTEAGRVGLATLEPQFP